VDEVEFAVFLLSKLENVQEFYYHELELVEKAVKENKKLNEELINTKELLSDFKIDNSDLVDQLNEQSDEIEKLKEYLGIAIKAFEALNDIANVEVYPCSQYASMALEKIKKE